MKFKNDGKLARYEADEGMTIKVTYEMTNPFTRMLCIAYAYHKLWETDGYVMRGYSETKIDAISDYKIRNIEEVVA